MSKGAMKVVLDGRGPLTLRDTDYMTSGGEGSIYRANDTIVKLYTDKKKMARDGMPDKVKLLASSLKHAGIVAPQGLVLDEMAQPIGFYMPMVQGEALPRMFVSDFRTRTGFGDADAVTLVEKMREIVAYAHAQKAVMVDANEMNWLVDVAVIHDPSPKVIDVDSWAIGRWPATVIMPSIRDWGATSFGELTDWFAFGIVAFQIFTGIHPYKGKLDGYKPGDLVKRMQARASVFTPGARLPHSVRDFSCIPGPFLDWCRTMFETGTRSMPPSAFAKGAPAVAARVLRAVTTAAGNLTFEKLFGRPGDPVIRIWPNGAALLASGAVVDLASGRTIGLMLSADGEVIRFADGWLIADWINGRPAMFFADNGLTATLPFLLSIKRYFRAGNRLFVITDGEMVEVYLRFLGKPVVVTGPRTSVRPNSTSWFDGVAVQDVLGAAFLILPIEGGGIVQPKVKELNGAKVIAAAAGGRFAVFIVLDKSGDYRKIELTFSKDFNSYKAWSGGTDSPDLNLGILANGIICTIVNDGELTLFVPANGDINKVQDKGITTAMRLSAWGEKLVYVHDGDVWRVRMKP